LQRKSAEFGFATLELEFMWIPDGYAGLRPGYPWFEAGELTLAGDSQANEEQPEPGAAEDEADPDPSQSDD